MRQGSRKRACGVAALAAAALAAAPAFAQGVGAQGGGAQGSNSPMTANLTFATNLDINTNPSLSATSSGTVTTLTESLSFGFRSETSTQIFDLGASGGISLSPGSAPSVSRPVFRLRYTRQLANADLTVGANYRRSSIASSFLLDPTNPATLVIDNGDLARTKAQITTNLRTNAPLSFTLDASYDRKQYFGITNPALFDETTVSYGATANLRLSPTTRAGLSTTITQYVATDAGNTQSYTMSYGLTLSHDLARGLTLNTRLGFTDKRMTTVGVTTRQTGGSFGVDVTQSLPDGAITGSAQYDASGLTPRTVLGLSRRFDLPRGTLNAGLKADIPQGGSVQLLGNASLTRQLPDGSFNLSFNQSINTNQLNQQYTLSTLSLGYQKTVSSDSALDLSFNLTRTQGLAGSGLGTNSRAALTASYTRNINSNWDLSVGYTHQQAGTSSTTANSDSLFLTLTRGMQFSF